MNDQHIVVYEIYDMWFHPFWRQPWFIIFCWCILGVSAFLCAVLLGRRLYRWWTKKNAWQRTQEVLASALRVQPYASRNQLHEMYIRLDCTVREYLSDHCKVGQRELTERELLAVLADDKRLWPWKEDLCTFYQRVIAVKYGHADQDVVSYDTLVTDVAALEEFVKNTKIFARPV